MSTSKKSRAGKRSGIKRAKLARLRQLLVLEAFENLKCANQIQPFADGSIDALQEELCKPYQEPQGLISNFNSASGKWEIVARLKPMSDKQLALCIEACDLLVKYGKDLPPLSTAKRETLIKDLKVLGIKSRRRKQRSR